MAGPGLLHCPSNCPLAPAGNHPKGTETLAAGSWGPPRGQNRPRRNRWAGGLALLPVSGGDLILSWRRAGLPPFPVLASWLGFRWPNRPLFQAGGKPATEGCTAAGPAKTDPATHGKAGKLQIQQPGTEVPAG